MPTIHRVAVAALVADGRLLLVHRRSDRAWYPDCWDLPGGHIEPGEQPAAAVRRECLEELGIEAHEVTPTPMKISDAEVEMHAFRVTDWAGEPANMAPAEHDAIGWFTAEEIPALDLADRASAPDLVALAQSTHPTPRVDE